MNFFSLFSNRKRESLKQLALDAETDGDFKLAKEIYRKALANGVLDWELAVRFASVLIILREKQEAESFLEYAIPRFPQEPLVLTYIQLDIDSYDLSGLDKIEEKLLRSPHDTALLGRAALMLAWHGDIESAKKRAKAAILHAPAENIRESVRRCLSRRIATLGYPEAADFLCEVSNGGRRNEHDILCDRLMVQAQNSVWSPETLQAFNTLLKGENFARREGLLLAYINFKWRFEGPSAELLRFFNEEIFRFGHFSNNDLLATQVSLALQVGEDEFAASIVRSKPELIRKFRAYLPIAKIASKFDVGTPAELMPRIESYASLFDAFDTNEKVITDRFSDSRRSIAVVGNSACETGRSRGPEIDGHDDVVRFNRFSIAPPFDKDYGSKVTVLVKVGTDKTEFELNIKDKMIVFISSASTAYRGRTWRSARRLHAEGHTLCAFPQKIHTKVTRLLGASPSTGICFAYMLKKLRGTLHRKDFFGFSFVDQINGESAHYFEKARPAAAHQWEKEKALFDRLFLKDAV